MNPRSLNQRRYVENIEAADMTFGIGPAGTGKTYLAVAMAASALMAKKVSRIILVRPAVEAGERLGFLPGSLQEKVDPYLRPLYDALYRRGASQPGAAHREGIRHPREAAAALAYAFRKHRRTGERNCNDQDDAVENSLLMALRIPAGPFARFAVASRHDAGLSPTSKVPRLIVIEPPSRGTGGAAFLSLRKPVLARFLKSAQRAVNLSGEVNLLLADDARLKTLNEAFRGKNKPTDVLSFPAAANAEGAAGDLAISVETAARQAAEHGHALEDELRVLTLHGLLHLAGYDHETDVGEMRALETSLRTKLKLPGGLIERTEPHSLKHPPRTTKNETRTPQRRATA